MIDLLRLREMLGDEAMVSKYISLFKQSAPDYMTQISESIRSGDLRSLTIAAHSLKTQFAYLKYDQAHELVSILEHVSEDEMKANKTGLEQIVADLNNCISEALQYMDKELNTQKS